MSSMAEKIIELRIATRSATMCESSDKKKKNTLSLMTKVLFLLKDRPLPPSDIIGLLQINKTNLAMMTTKLAEKGFIERRFINADKRKILLAITPSGKDYLDKKLEVIEQSCKKSFTGAEYDEACKKIDEAKDVLSFMI